MSLLYAVNDLKKLAQHDYELTFNAIKLVKKKETNSGNISRS